MAGFGLAIFAGTGISRYRAALLRKVVSVLQSTQLQKPGQGPERIPAKTPAVRVGGLRSAATFTVNDTGDDPDLETGDGVCATARAVCTLRAAIAEANATTAADVISITATGTIDLRTALPDITQSLTIEGPGANVLTVKRALDLVQLSTYFYRDPPINEQFRIFTVPTSGLEIVIRGMTIAYGSGIGRGYGGNIFSRSNITVSDCELLNGAAGVAYNSSVGHAGGSASAIENANATIE